MRQTLIEREKELVAYAAKLAEIDDAGLTDEAANYAWLSAYAANNPRSIYHAKCDATYAEAARRGKPWLYARGWNQAFRLAGHEPTESDIARESPDHPIYAKEAAA